MSKLSLVEKVAVWQALTIKSHRTKHRKTEHIASKLGQKKSLIILGAEKSGSICLKSHEWIWGNAATKTKRGYQMTCNRRVLKFGISIDDSISTIAKAVLINNY